MPERRMFARSVVCADKFLAMPSKSQALYFQLSMNADDDGFVGNVNLIKRYCRCRTDDFKPLIDNGYILQFDSGVIAISHFKMCNKIRKLLYKPTQYQTELLQLRIDNFGVYRDILRTSIGKDSSVKVRVVDERVESGEISSSSNENSGSCFLNAPISAPLKNSVAKLLKVYPDLIVDEMFLGNQEKLIKCINKSDFLKNFKKPVVSWLNKNYEKILSGYYETYQFSSKQNSEFENRTYTKEQLESVFDNLDDIEI